MTGSANQIPEVWSPNPDGCGALLASPHGKTSQMRTGSDVSGGVRTSAVAAGQLHGLLGASAARRQAHALHVFPTCGRRSLAVEQIPAWIEICSNNANRTDEGRTIRR